MPPSVEHHRSHADLTADDLREQGAAGLATLFEFERPRLLRLIQRHLGSELMGRVDGSDLVQDAFVAASRQLRAYLADESVPPYLWIREVTLSVIEKTKHTHLGTAKRAISSEEEVEMSGLLVELPSPRSQVARHETVRIILEQMQQMRENDRRILELRHVELLSLREVSVVLNLGYNTVRKRYIRALDRLRKAMRRLDSHD